MKREKFPSDSFSKAEVDSIISAMAKDYKVDESDIRHLYEKGAALEQIDDMYYTGWMKK